MGMRSLAAAVLLILLAVFAVANWGAFTAPTSLTLGFTSVQAPLGLLMLGLCALVALALGGLALWLHTRSLMELRRQAKQQQALRELADKAETSRLVQLQAALESGLQRLGAQIDASRQQLDQRIDLLQHEQARHVAETANGLAAALAEFDERMSRRGGSPG
ncbi:MAG: DUF1049 domain-containing protein [Betaproteobacteria bacterium]|nr:DUF1049 domain-containing protein [Betaproteobacteria bacterium]